MSHPPYMVLNNRKHQWPIFRRRPGRVGTFVERPRPGAWADALDTKVAAVGVGPGRRPGRRDFRVLGFRVLASIRDPGRVLRSIPLAGPVATNSRSADIGPCRPVSSRSLSCGTRSGTATPRGLGTASRGAARRGSRRPERARVRTGVLRANRRSGCPARFGSAPNWVPRPRHCSRRPWCSGG